MSINSLTNEILEKILLEIRKKENIEKIHENVIDPLVNYTFQKIYPYVIITSIIFLLTFLSGCLTTGSVGDKDFQNVFGFPNCFSECLWFVKFFFLENNLVNWLGLLKTI